MIDIMKMIRNGEMSKEFYRKLADDCKDETTKNSRMRFKISALFDNEVYSLESMYSMTVTEYADVCEGETLTSQSVCCECASLVIQKLISNNKSVINYSSINTITIKDSTIAYVEQQLREQFNTLNLFLLFCDENGIEYKKQPMWVDNHSFNEYTGEHRGEFAPFANKKSR